MAATNAKNKKTDAAHTCVLALFLYRYRVKKHKHSQYDKNINIADTICPMGSFAIVRAAVDTLLSTATRYDAHMPVTDP